MRIWIVTPGEPAVYHPEAAASKPMRAALLAGELARRGHEVVWWTGSFQHETKQFLQPAGEMTQTSIRNLSLYLLPSRGYKKNISISRMVDYSQLAREWRKAANQFEIPHLVLGSLPPIELAFSCLNYCLHSGSKFAVDVRDLWPDIIYSRLIRGIPQRYLPKLLPHYDYMNRRLFAQADAVIGVTDAFVNWALAKVGRSKSPFDKGFYLSSLPLDEIDSKTNAVAMNFWADRGVVADRRPLKFCWVGSLSDQKAIRTTIDRFINLPVEIARHVQFIVCGRGTLESRIAAAADSHDHIAYGGYIDKAQYSALLSMTSYGLLIYEPTFDFQRNIPNKVNEYLSGGAHVLSTLTGEVQNLLDPQGVFTELDLSSQGAFDRQIEELAERGPVDESGRILAKSIYRENFSSSTIYTRYADHLEMVAGS